MEINFKNHSCLNPLLTTRRWTWVKKMCIYWPGSFQLDWWMQIRTTSTILKATGTWIVGDLLWEISTLTVTNGHKDAAVPGLMDLWWHEVKAVKHCVLDYKSSYSCKAPNAPSLMEKYALYSGQTSIGYNLPFAERGTRRCLMWMWPFWWWILTALLLLLLLLLLWLIIIFAVEEKHLKSVNMWIKKASDILHKMKRGTKRGLHALFSVKLALLGLLWCFNCIIHALCTVKYLFVDL